MSSTSSERMRFQLNRQAEKIVRRMCGDAARLRIQVHGSRGKKLVIDCGIEARGGLEAGRLLAEACMAGLGRVEIVSGNAELWPGPAVAVRTDAPVAACMAAQYAGWKV